jgi:flagellar protein FlaG
MDIGNTINRLDSNPALASQPAVPGPVRAAAPSQALAKGASAESTTPAVAANVAAATRTPTKAEVKDSVDAINRFLEDNSEVLFSIDEDSGISVVKVIDTETKKVLQQFPSEQSLEIGKNLTSLKGLLINSQA